MKIVKTYFNEKEISNSTKILFYTNFGCKGCNNSVSKKLATFLKNKNNLLISTEKLPFTNYLNYKFDSLTLIENTETSFTNSCLFFNKNGILVNPIEISVNNIDEFYKKMLE